MSNITAETSSNVFYQARCKASTHNDQLSSREGAADLMSIETQGLEFCRDASVQSTGALCLANNTDDADVIDNHLKVAIDEIEEDCSKQGEHYCSECEYLKMYDYGKRIYYCDHVDRIDDMGKLSIDHPPKTSPKWCPK